MTNTIKRFLNKNVLRQQFQPIELVGITTTNQPALSASGESRLYYDSTIGALMLSKEGAAYNNLAGGLTCAEVTFAEAGVAGVYTGSVSVPAGATIIDIIVNGVALWGAGTSATMKVGDVATDDGYFTGVNLKATDLLAGESISFAQAGGKAGAYIANSQVSPRYSASARVVSGIVTTVGTTSSVGRTRMLVLFAAATATTPATKV